jgi:hypothetical protein
MTNMVANNTTQPAPVTVISPLLANIYLHYVLDLWAEQWRRRESTGDMIIVRYPDDVVAGFEHEDDARRFLDAMRERMGEFSLTLHPYKTRLIAFGRYAAERRAKAGLGKPQTFDFLGFTFLCGRSRGGGFQVRRRSRRDRMRAKLREIKEELRRRMHQSIPDQGQWLRQIVQRVFAYHAVPTNERVMAAFRSTLEAGGGGRQYFSHLSQPSPNCGPASHGSSHPDRIASRRRCLRSGYRSRCPRLLCTLSQEPARLPIEDISQPPNQRRGLMDFTSPY